MSDQGGGLARRDEGTLPAELSVPEVVAQVQKIQEVMAQAMTQGEHYGTIPGTNKPTLLKPGAEKLCLTFRLDPEYELREVYGEGGHYTVTATCTLYHIPTGDRIASGLGLCSTHESKYAYRKGQRVCPDCGTEAIIKGKAEYGGGWLCWRKKDGCGGEFNDDDPRILSQETGRVANADLADSWNTVLKMATKRSLVAAVLNGTAASDIFTQDIEEAVPGDPEGPSEGSPAGTPHPSVANAGTSRTPPGQRVLDRIREAVPANLQGDAKDAVKEGFGIGNILRLPLDQINAALELVEQFVEGPGPDNPAAASDAAQSQEAAQVAKATDGAGGDAPGYAPGEEPF